ncbi:hypothetical protein UFOVP119_30 [uncultured Caudovirales phage]|uniref:Uncharacterized protein n=1 Tax=uncultured Caudovirales phage TaxID=2100421 RepID=A0A6J5LAY6_9CAUD|nr:hypothetical protein UFOVP119_30 [uncultured Caudovirales phage]
MKALILALAVAPAAHAAELYASAGIAHQFHHGRCTTPAGITALCAWDRNEYAPGLAHIEIGVAKSAGRFTFQLYARHESLSAHRDYGVDQAGLDIRVRLLGRQ